MTIFTPYQNTPPPPDYGRLSREIDVGRSVSTLGTALEGVGNTFSLGVKAVDEINKGTIDKELYKLINTERTASIQEGMGLLGESQTTPTTAEPIGNKQYQDSYAPTDLTPDRVPPGVAQGMRRFNMLAQANRMGRLDDVDFYAKISSGVQDLVSRYGGYQDYIRQKTSSILGTDPVNAQRHAIQASLQQMYGRSNTEYNQWVNDVEKWGKYLGADGTKEAISAFGDPTKMANIRAHVAGQMQSEHIQDRTIKDLDAELKISNVDKNRAEGALNLVAGQTYGRMMSGIIFRAGNFALTGDQAFQKLQEMRAQGDTNPDTLRALGMILGQVNDAWETTYSNIIRNPQFTDRNGQRQSFASLMKDSAAISNVKNLYTGQLQSMIRNVGADRLELATASASWNKLAIENETARVLSIPAARALAGMDKAFGQSGSTVINLMHTQDKWKGINQLAAGLLQMYGTTVTGGTNGQPDVPGATPNGLRQGQVILETARPGEKPTPAENRAIVNVAKWGVTQKENNEIAINWAEHIAHGGTTDFIQTMAKNQQFDVWATIATPAVAKRVEELSRDKPELKERYEKWVATTFKRLFDTYIEDVQQTAISNRRIDPRWNEADKRIDYNDPRANLRGGGTGGFPPIDRLNTGLRVLRTNMEAMGRELNADTLKELGLDLDRRFEGAPWLNKVMDSLKEMGRKIDKESTPSKLFEGERPSRSPSQLPRGANPTSGDGFSVPVKTESYIRGQSDLAPQGRFDEVFDQVQSNSTNEPLLEEGLRRLEQRSRRSDILPDTESPPLVPSPWPPHPLGLTQLALATERGDVGQNLSQGQKDTLRRLRESRDLEDLEKILQSLDPSFPGRTEAPKPVRPGTKVGGRTII